MRICHTRSEGLEDVQEPVFQLRHMALVKHKLLQKQPGKAFTEMRSGLRAG